MGYAKVTFRLEQDDSGYPPESSELLWAESLSNGNFRIDNIPFFAQEVSCEDEISVEAESSGTLVYKKTIIKSKNSVFRVIPSSEEAIDVVRKALRDLGCRVELYANLWLLAVEIPSAVEINPVLEFLMDERSSGHLDFEEGALRHKL